MALKLRTIDGYVGGSDYMEDFKLKEVIKTYIKEPNLTCIVCEHIINMNSFNKLPAALRERIQRDARHAELDWTMHMTVNNSRLQSKLTKENGIKFVTLPQNEQEEIMKAILIVWDSIAAKSPRCAKLIDIIKAVARDAGKMK
jgi:TRAP-type C4-dicarboxylate transport system substrate-binding protein